MRRRLNVVLLGVTLAVVLAFGVIRGYAVASLVRGEEQARVERTAQLLAAAVDEGLFAPQPVTAASLERVLGDEERIIFTTPDGESVQATSEGYRAEGGRKRGEPSAEARASDGSVITVVRSARHAQEHVISVIRDILILGLLLLLLVGTFGYLAAARLAWPFRDLARVSREFAAGDFRVEVPRYDVREANELAEAMRQSQRRISDLVHRERDLALHASHMLLTPITALRLELEDLSMWPETPSSVAGHLRLALREIDRLSETVDEIINVARGHSFEATEQLDLCALVGESVQRCSVVAQRQGRRIVTQPQHHVQARVAPRAVSQVVDILLDNALEHGRGTVTAEVCERDTHVAVRICDEGEILGEAAADIFGRGIDAGPRDGVGLRVGRELAEAMGGHLVLDRLPPTTFTLMLPKTVAQGVDS